MVKKKTVNKKVPHRRSKKTVKPRVVSNGAIDIDNDDDTLSFNIRGTEGELLGVVESSVCDLHRIALISQGEAMDKGDADASAYMPIFAKKLSERFNVSVSESAAYRMANHIFIRFEEQKKSTVG